MYQWLERLVFGNKLQRARTAYLEEVSSRLQDGDRILLIGDGDGRFLQELLDHTPSISVDYIEPCAAMITEAKKRVASDSRVHWIQKTIEQWYSESNIQDHHSNIYTLIVSHFVFDSLEGSHLPAILESIRSLMAPNSLWLLADFDSSTSRSASVIVTGMYLFFYLTAGVHWRKLKKFNPLFESQQLYLHDQKESMNGLIYSQLWGTNSRHNPRK